MSGLARWLALFMMFAGIVAVFAVGGTAIGHAAVFLSPLRGSFDKWRGSEVQILRFVHFSFASIVYIIGSFFLSGLLMAPCYGNPACAMASGFMFLMLLIGFGPGLLAVNVAVAVTISKYTIWGQKQQAAPSGEKEVEIWAIFS